MRKTKAKSMKKPTEPTRASAAGVISIDLEDHVARALALLSKLNGDELYMLTEQLPFVAGRWGTMVGSEKVRVYVSPECSHHTRIAASVQKTITGWVAKIWRLSREKSEGLGLIPDHILTPELLGREYRTRAMAMKACDEALVKSGVFLRAKGAMP